MAKLAGVDNQEAIRRQIVTQQEEMINHHEDKTSLQAYPS